MAETHVVSGLKDKRAELAGQIQALQKQIDGLKADLFHIDATLKIFSPECDPGEIAPRRQWTRNGIFDHGELPRLILDILRDRGRPLSAQDITGIAMVQKGLEPTVVRVADEIRDQVSRALSRQKKLGSIQSEVGPDRLLVWSIAD